MSILDKIMSTTAFVRKVDSVKVPEIDSVEPTMYLAQLSADEKDSMELSWQEHKESNPQFKKGEGFRSWCVACCMCDAIGNLLVDRSMVVEVASRLGKSPAPAVARAFDMASKLNGITEEDAKALEAEAEKN